MTDFSPCRPGSHAAEIQLRSVSYIEIGEEGDKKKQKEKENSFSALEETHNSYFSVTYKNHALQNSPSL